MLPDLTGDSNSSDEEMFDQAYWKGERLDGWPIKDSSDYYHFVPFGGSTICTDAGIAGGTSYSQTLFVSTGGVEKQDVEGVNTQDVKDVDPQSTDGEEHPSFIPPQSKHGNNKPEAKWEDMDKASQARLTFFYELHKVERGDKDDVKLWKDISNMILNGKHDGSIKCKSTELNFSCCRVRARETGDMCRALVVAKSSSKMWKEGQDVQCRRCQSQIGFAVYQKRQKEKHGFVKKKYQRKPY
jgi:hypothetical protein